MLASALVTLVAVLAPEDDTVQTLIYTQTGDVVRINDTVVDFRGESARVTGWREPHKPSSTGRVFVIDRAGNSGEYFPSVYDLHFAEITVNPKPKQESEPVKAIYWTNVQVGNPSNVLAFAVRVLPSDDERLEKRRASIAARRKARSMAGSAGREGVSVQSIERIQPNDYRIA